MLQQSGGVLTSLRDPMFTWAGLSEGSALESGISAADTAPKDGGRLERLVEVSNEVTGVALAVIDGQLQYVDVNRRLAALNGISVDAHFGRTICSVVPEIGAMLARLADQALQSKRPIRDVRFTARVPFVSGPLRTWQAGFFPVDLGGGSVGIAHTVIEISDFARVEAALAEFAPVIPEPRHPEPLTSRETDVLTLIGQGKTTKEIAALLSISDQTVGNHRKRICRKLNLHSTVELASYAARER